MDDQQNAAVIFDDRISDVSGIRQIDRFTPREFDRYESQTVPVSSWNTWRVREASSPMNWSILMEEMTQYAGNVPPKYVLILCRKPPEESAARLRFRQSGSYPRRSVTILVVLRQPLSQCAGLPIAPVVASIAGKGQITRCARLAVLGNDVLPCEVTTLVRIRFGDSQEFPQSRLEGGEVVGIFVECFQKHFRSRSIQRWRELGQPAGALSIHEQEAFGQGQLNIGAAWEDQLPTQLNRSVPGKRW